MIDFVYEQSASGRKLLKIWSWNTHMAVQLVWCSDRLLRGVGNGDQIEAYEHELIAYVSKLQAIEGLTIYVPKT